MGGSRWDDDDWKAYASTNVGASAQQTYTSTTAKAAYAPKSITVRESKISDANPNPTPIIVGLDQTGSMERVMQAGMTGLGTLFTEIYAREPVSDPHVLAMFIGDVISDRYPLQATQFEADIKIAEQLKELYHEGNGGGNGSESYHLPLYFAAFKTDCDAFDQGRKGFIFTIGDEGVPPDLTPAQIKSVFGPDENATESLSYKTLVQMLSDNWNVFHLRVQQGYSYSSHQDAAWKDVLGERALPLSNIEDLASVIVATLQVVGGADAHAVAQTFSGSTAVTVLNATKGLTVPNNNTGGVVNL